ncbi:MAG: hypothetical protein GXP22_10100 [Gammaproteobacteria bacterium]|nr:hypothetical protein [Gammaproteobacteria bacterium]
MNGLSLSETRRKYIPVGSTPASMRATVSAKDRPSMSLAVNVFIGAFSIKYID